MVPEDMIQRWESAYRRYGEASRAAGSASMSTEQGAAREFAEASRDVAAAWHDLERVPGLPWWMLAALVAAGQAFDVQAREWTARAAYSAPTAVAPPPVRLATRARPHPRRRGERS